MLKKLLTLLCLYSGSGYAAGSEFLVVGNSSGTEFLTNVVSPSLKAAQTFTTVNAFKMTHIKVGPYCNDLVATTCYATLEIWNTSGGAPSTKISGTESLMMPLTNTFGSQTTFRFLTPVSLAASTTYALVLTYVDGALNLSGRQSNVYPGGQTYSYSGGSWSATGYDAYFGVYGTTASAADKSDIDSGYYDPMLSGVVPYVHGPVWSGSTGVNYVNITSSTNWYRSLYKITGTKSTVLKGPIWLALSSNGTVGGYTMTLGLWSTSGTTAQFANKEISLATINKLGSVISSCSAPFPGSVWCPFDLPAAGIEVPANKNILFEFKVSGGDVTNYIRLGGQTVQTSAAWSSAFSTNSGSSWSDFTPSGSGYFMYFIASPPTKVFYQRVKNVVTVHFNGVTVPNPYQGNQMVLTLPIGRTDGAFSSTKDSSFGVGVGTQTITVPLSSQATLSTQIPTVTYSLKNVP